MAASVHMLSTVVFEPFSLTTFCVKTYLQNAYDAIHHVLNEIIPVKVSMLLIIIPVYIVFE
jgi:hypothetical protein